MLLQSKIQASNHKIKKKQHSDLLSFRQFCYDADYHPNNGQNGTWSKGDQVRHSYWSYNQHGWYSSIRSSCSYLYCSTKECWIDFWEDNCSLVSGANFNYCIDCSKTRSFSYILLDCYKEPFFLNYPHIRVASVPLHVSKIPCV